MAQAALVDPSLALEASRRWYQQHADNQSVLETTSRKASVWAERAALWIADKLSGRDQQEEAALKQAQEWFQEQKERQSLADARQLYAENERRKAAEAAAAAAAAAATAAAAAAAAAAEAERQRLEQEAQRQREEQRKAELLQALEESKQQALSSLLPPHMQHYFDDCVSQYEGEARSHVAMHFVRSLFAEITIGTNNALCLTRAGWGVLHVEINPFLIGRGEAFVRFMRARLTGLQLDVKLVTRLTPHTSHLTPHTSHLTPHTSHLTPHTSHLTPHTSHLTPHTAHLTPHTLHVTRHFSSADPPAMDDCSGSSRIRLKWQSPLPLSTAFL